MGSSLWGWFLSACVLAFAGLEIAGYLGAPWGTMTVYIRRTMDAYPWLDWVVAGLLPFAYLHLFAAHWQ